ncbi:MAG: AMP-binding protein, partial [Bacillota bacterium]|nr:AMP-binding protein [Bacillota bacterium]
MTASAWFFARARLAGERVALVDGTGSPPLWGSSPGKWPSYTYRALAERALRLAVLLKERGIGKGDRIALLSQNHVAYVDLLLAAASLGAILVPFNIRLPEGELRPLQEDAAPALLFYHPDLAALAAHLPGEKISLGDHYEEDLSRVPRERAKALEEALFKGEMGAGLEDPWLILYTGGTTGVPKGALIPHRQVIFNAINTTGSWELTSEDAAPVFTPLFHTGGLHVFLTPLLHSGGKLVLGGAFQPEKAVELTREEGLTLFFAVPTMYQLLLDEPSFRKANLQTVRWFISGGAPCPLPIYEAFAAQGLLFKEGYGLTEAGPNNFALPLEKLTEKRGSVGLPVLHARAKVVDDTGQDLPPGAVGELLLGGPHLFSGYWQKEEE